MRGAKGDQVRSSTLVIGAGPSGLVALKTLRAAGIDAVAFEASPVLGGQWVIDNPSGMSSAYQSLETNTTRAMSRLSDFDFPPDDNAFVGREELLAWWHRYVDRFALSAHIVHETSVTSLTRSDHPAGAWAVTTNRSETAQHFDSVVIACGNYWDPKRLDLPGSFDGAQFHATDYRSAQIPVDVRGQRVMVVGPGSTGCEIAAEIARSGASKVWLSARSGVRLSPKTAKGVPVTASVPFLHPTEQLPLAVGLMPEGLRRRLFRFAAGRRSNRSDRRGGFDYLAHGLPAPPHPLDKRTSTSQTIFSALRGGTVEGCGEVVELDGSDAVLRDSTRRTVDVIVEATGYHMTFPFCSPDLLDTSGDDISLYRRVMHPQHHDLFVVGIIRPIGSFWPVAEAQAQWIAAHLSGASAFPSERYIKRKTEGVMATAVLPAFYGHELRADAARRRGNRW